MRAFCVSCVFVVASCAGGSRVVVEDVDEAAVTVVSWNVNYGGVGADVVVDVLDGLDADVVVLQETTPLWEALLRQRLGEKYPGMAFHHGGGAGGLAILGKGAVVVDVIPAVSWFPAARAVVETALGPVQVLDVHLRPPFGDEGSMPQRIVSGAVVTPSIRASEMKTFLRSLEERGGAVVVAGDFNEGSGGAVDAVTGAGFSSALDDAGVDDPTWHWDGVPFRLRMDHVFYDDDLALVGARVVDVEGASDHFPVVARFQKRRS